MKSIDRIPTSKVQRASKIVTTGLKVGVNYAKYVGQKMISDEVQAKAALNSANAEDIYDGLKELKGSALKVAQMLSMEKNILPRAYVEKFSLAQFSVPPLSAPLVKKTFRRYFSKNVIRCFYANAAVLIIQLEGLPFCSLPKRPNRNDQWVIEVGVTNYWK